MSLYRLTNENLTKIKHSSFTNIGMLETQIQSIIEKNPKALGEDLLILSREIKPSEGSLKRADLLALDKNGNLVIIEFKRDDDGFHMDLQALRYSAMVSQYNCDDIENVYTQYLAKYSDEKDFIAKERIEAFLEEDAIPCQNVRIILVNQNFSKELTSCVLWLNEQGLDITCIKVTPYKIDELQHEILLDIDKIIPLKEAEEYLLNKRENAKELKRERSSKDYTRYIFNGESNLPKRKVVLNIVKKYTQNHPAITYDELLKVFPKDFQGSFGVFRCLDEINEKYKGSNRFFMKEDEIITLADNIKIAVCNGWGNNFFKLLEFARSELNYEIIEEKDED